MRIRVDTEQSCHFRIGILSHLIVYRYLYHNRIEISSSRTLDMSVIDILVRYSTVSYSYIHDTHRIRLDTLYRKGSRYVQERKRCPCTTPRPCMRPRRPSRPLLWRRPEVRAPWGGREAGGSEEGEVLRLACLLVVPVVPV